MKIRTQFIATLVVFFTLIGNVKAQYVTIPDPGMVTWLTANYPSAMNGNQMDTTDNSVLFEDTLYFNYSNVINLDGIQYFDNLTLFKTQFTSIQVIPALPPNLIHLEVVSTNITTLPDLPNGLETLKCWSNNLNQLPELPNSLIFLSCGTNNLTSLPELPNSLQSLFCAENYLINLPDLPISLVTLDCNSNYLTTIPPLPNSLIELDCSSNNLISFPTIPNSLNWFSCSNCNLSELPILPNTLKTLHCSSNNFTILSDLPDSLEILYCHSCNLTSINSLPLNLIVLGCANNNLSSLPELSNNLQGLICSNNQNLGCLPLLPDNLISYDFTNTSLICLPNYPDNLYFQSSLPLCQPNNPNGCITSNSISGAFFDNSNNSCINNANLSTNATIKLYDDQNNFLQSRSASSDDHYYFSIEPGNYVVSVDSSFITNGVNLSCPVSGEHDVTALIDSSYSDRDFGLNCVGVDLGVEAILPQGIVFPGQPHSLKAIAGDLSNYFGLNCAAGTGGTVEITVTGPVTYVDYPSTALAPVVNGTTFTYSISDFSNVNLQEAFVLNFLTNTTAQATNLISVTAQISSNATDLDLSNNATSFSYFVVNSYDPNMKEVNPVNVLPGYDDYFTYTVHFQNMGNAPAFNIKIKDTLDQNLDFETFRVINASHPYSYNLTSDLLNVYFPNIMLADSASDPEGSKGFVQYQVKPKANLPLGTTIENTAHIYFDFNPAVVTNTTTNEFVQTLGLSDDAFGQWSIAPNPNNGTFSVQLKHAPTEQLNVFVLDNQGRKMVQETVPAFSKSCTLQTTLAPGVYFLQLSSGNKNSEMKRVVVE